MVKIVVSGRIWVIFGVVVGFSMSLFQHAQLTRLMAAHFANDDGQVPAYLLPPVPVEKKRLRKKKKSTIHSFYFGEYHDKLHARTNLFELPNDNDNNDDDDVSLLQKEYVAPSKPIETKKNDEAYHVKLHAKTTIFQPGASDGTQLLRIAPKADEDESSPIVPKDTDDDDAIRRDEWSEEKKEDKSIRKWLPFKNKPTPNDEFPEVTTPPLVATVQTLQHRAKLPSQLKDTDDSFPLEDIVPEMTLSGFDPDRLVFFHTDAMERDRAMYLESTKNIATKSKIVQPAVRFLLRLANQSLAFGPWSVMDKPRDSLAPSKDPHDYYHPFGTILHGKDSNDQSRMASMQYNTTVLALSYYMTQDERYAKKAAQNIRVWFLDPATRMNPHLTFGNNVMESKDVSFFLDAVRIVGKGGFFATHEIEEVRDWFRQYLSWLRHSQPGRLARQTPGLTGLYYDIQVLSVAAFVDDTEALQFHLNWNLDRLDEQIDQTDGSLRHQEGEERCEDFRLAVLHGWSTMARIALSIANVDLWGSYKTQDATSALCMAAKHAVPYFRARPPCEGNNREENYRRWWPLVQEARFHCPDLAETPMVWNTWMSIKNKVPITSYQMPSMYNPLDAIPPFWNLGAPNGANVWSINQPAIPALPSQTGTSALVTTTKKKPSKLSSALKTIRNVASGGKTRKKEEEATRTPIHKTTRFVPLRPPPLNFMTGKPGTNLPNDPKTTTTKKTITTTKAKPLETEQLSAMVNQMFEPQN